jgi:hypothetical protein
MFKEKLERNFILIFVALAFILYAIIVLNQNPVDIDYQLVISPLKQINSFSDYLHFSGTQQSVDLQPIRDFSLKLDLMLEHLTGLSFHGFFNVLFWIASGIMLILIMRALSLKKELIYLISFLFITHPLGAWIVSWPSARKHLLALFFISVASYFSVKLKQNKLKYEILIFIFYLLSILSQPISLLWIVPFFFYFFDEIKSRKLMTLFYFLLAAFLMISIANKFYYSYVYQFASGAPKMIETSVDQAISIAAISRSLSQIFFPIHFAFDYVKSSFLGILGLPIFTLFIFWGIKRIQFKKTLLLTVLILSPLILVYYKPTNIFVSDTYIIIPLFFTLLSLGIFLEKINLTKTITTCLIVVVIIFSGKNILEQYYASDEYRHSKISYDREPSCRNALPYALKELNSHHFENFKKITDIAMSEQCVLFGGGSSVLTSRLYLYRVLIEEKLSMKDKYSISNKMTQVTPDIVMVQSILDYLINKKKYVPPEMKIISHIQETERLLIKTIVFKLCKDDKTCDQEKLIKLFKN